MNPSETGMAPAAPPIGPEGSPIPPAQEAERTPEMGRPVSAKAEHIVRTNFGKDTMVDGVHEGITEAAFHGSQDEREKAYDINAKFGVNMLKWLSSERDADGKITKWGMEDWIGQVVAEGSPSNILEETVLLLANGDSDSMSYDERQALLGNVAARIDADRGNQASILDITTDGNGPNRLAALQIYARYLDTQTVQVGTTEVTAKSRYDDLVNTLATKLKVEGNDDQTRKNIEAVAPLLNVLGVQSGDVMQLILKVNGSPSALGENAGSEKIYPDEEKSLKFLWDHHAEGGLAGNEMPQMSIGERPTPPTPEPPLETSEGARDDDLSESRVGRPGVDYPDPQQDVLVPFTDQEASRDGINEIHPSKDLIARYGRVPQFSLDGSGQVYDPEQRRQIESFMDTIRLAQPVRQPLPINDTLIDKIIHSEAFFVQDGSFIRPNKDIVDPPLFLFVGGGRDQNPTFNVGENSGEQVIAGQQNFFTGLGALMGGEIADPKLRAETQASAGIALGRAIVEIYQQRPQHIETFLNAQQGDASLQTYLINSARNAGYTEPIDSYQAFDNAMMFLLGSKEPKLFEIQMYAIAGQPGRRWRIDEETTSHKIQAELPAVMERLKKGELTPEDAMLVEFLGNGLRVNKLAQALAQEVKITPVSQPDEGNPGGEPKGPKGPEEPAISPTSEPHAATVAGAENPIDDVEESKHKILNQISEAVRINEQADRKRLTVEQMPVDIRAEEDNAALTPRTTPDQEQVSMIHRWVDLNKTTSDGTVRDSFQLDEGEFSALQQSFDQGNYILRFSKDFGELGEINQETTVNEVWFYLRPGKNGAIFGSQPNDLFMIIKNKNNNGLLKDGDGKSVVALSKHFRVDGMSQPVLDLLAQNFPAVHFVFADNLNSLIESNASAAS